MQKKKDFTMMLLNHFFFGKRFWFQAGKKLRKNASFRFAFKLGKIQKEHE